MTLYRLKTNEQKHFAEMGEIFSGLQLGLMDGKHYLIVGDLVAVLFDDQLRDELDKFADQTWDKAAVGGENDNLNLERYYEGWLNSLGETPQSCAPYEATRGQLFSFVTAGVPPSIPPPPPNRPNLIPIPPSSRYPGLPAVQGHLPFKTRTGPREVF